MKTKLGERDATLYYELIDYEAYQDLPRSKKTDLEEFFQELTNDPLLMHQFESITAREQFIKLATRLGAGRGYTFTTTELEDAIEASTAAEQGEYFCLPIGCWHKAKTA